jgi:DNA-binding response OmpR family regulator
MDTGKCRVTLKGKPVELSSKEYEILKVLMEAEGRVLQRDYFFNEVWGHGTSFDTKTRTLDVHIRHLREKLKSEAHRIVTVKYVGYRFDFGEE